MRPQYLAGVIAGIMLIYLGVFGTAGFGFSLGGSLYTKNFTDLSGWVTFAAFGAQIPSISGTRVYLESGAWLSDGRDTRSCIYEAYEIVTTVPEKIEAEGGFGGSPVGYTIEINAQTTSWGTSGKGFFHFMALFSNYQFSLVVQTSGIYDGCRGFAPDPTTNPWVKLANSPATIDTQNHIYTLVAKDITHVDVWLDNTKVGTILPQVPPNPDERFELETGWGALSYVSYVKVDKGLFEPTSGPSPSPSPTPSQSTITLTISGTGTTSPYTPAGSPYYGTVGGSWGPVTASTTVSGWSFQQWNRGGSYYSNQATCTFTNLQSTENIQAIFTYTTVSPTQGTMTLYTRYWTGTAYNAISVPVTVTKNSGSYATWYTDSSGTYGPIAVDPGTYGFSAQYLSLGTQTASVTIVAGDVKSATLTWSSGTTPPPDIDIFKMIIDFLNGQLVRQLMTLLGIVIIIPCSVMFVGPFKRHPAPAPSYQSY